MPDKIYFDGSCQPRNPGGTGGWGFVIRDENGQELVKQYGVLKSRPNMTNNVAEYCAAGAAVKAYKELGREGPVFVMGDSKMVIEQMRGAWAARKGSYIPVYQKLQELVKKCDFRIMWEWVPREDNAEADALAVLGLEEIGIQRKK